MGITQLNFDGKDKVEQAIELIQAYEPPEGYYLAFSGGKDSTIIYDLAVKSGVKFDAHYCVSPIDPPQIFDFIKKNYPDVAWDYHARGFWKLVAKNGLPLRQARWCCRYIKEAGGLGRVKMLGIRNSEGRGGRRRHAKCFEGEIKHKGTFRLSPIIGWDDSEVWEYLSSNDLETCELYQQGFTRVGCVLCPFDRKIKRAIEMFPKTVRAWQRASERYWQTRISPKHKTAEEYFNWWVYKR